MHSQRHRLGLGNSTKMRMQEEDRVLACTLQAHPKLQTCNAILYQVGRIDWKEWKGIKLQESEGERTDFCP